MASRRHSHHSQQSEVMLNVSLQEDESVSPRHGYREGEPLSRSTSAGSRNDKPRPEDSVNIQVRATQDKSNAGDEAPRESTVQDRGTLSQLLFPEQIEDSYEVPPLARSEDPAVQPAESQGRAPPTKPSDAAMSLRNDGDDDDDEMYSISPDGKAKHQAAVSAGKLASTQRATQGSPTQIVDRSKQDGHESRADLQSSEDRQTAPLMQDDQTDDDPVIPNARSRNAIDELLEGGAVAGTPIEPPALAGHSVTAKNKQHSGQMAPTTSKEARVTKAQQTKNVPTRPTKASATTTQSKRAVNVPVEDAVRGETSKARPVRAAKHSALVALHTKRGEMYSTQPERNDSVSGDEVAVAKPKKKGIATNKETVTKEKKQLPTPLTNGSDARQKDRRPATGKLPTHLPRSAVAAFNQVKAGGDVLGRKRKAESEEGDVDDQQSFTASRSGALKRPSKSAKGAEVKVPRKDAYEVSEDDNDMREAPKAGRLPPGTSKRPLKDDEPPRRTGRLAAVSSTRRPSKPRRSDSRASKASTVKVDPGRKVRQRMQEESVSARATPAPEHCTIDTQSRALQETSLQGRDRKRQKDGKDLADGNENARHVPLQKSLTIDRTTDHAGNNHDEPTRAKLDGGIVSRSSVNRFQIKLEKISKPVHIMPEHDPSEPVQGESQKQPIEVPDDSSSSSGDSSVAPPVVLQSEPEAPSGSRPTRPETPANNFRSSPPASERVPASVLQSARPQIIRFGASGPRNQGTFKPGLVSGRSTPFPLDKSEPGLEKASSQARLRARKRETHVYSIKKSNVATAGEDIFAGFAGDGNGPELKQPNPKAKPISTANYQDDHDHGFVPIDNFDDATLVAQSPPSIQQSMQPTASQLIMPPPGDQTKVPKKVGKLSRVQETAKSSAKDSLKLGSPAVPKRKHTELVADKPEPPSKRTKPNDLRLDHTTALKKPHITPALKIEAEVSKRKPAPPEPTTRQFTKATRQASQGSRRVDMLGSPIPSGMAVDARATVREVYSQQANFSSDRITEVAEASAKAVRQPVAVAFAINIPLKSTQPEIMSSNTKPLPAAPHEESRAIHRRVSGAQANQLITTEPTTDPFTTSSHDTGTSSQRVKKPTAFQRKLQQDFGITAETSNSRSRNRQQAVEDPDRTLVDEVDHTHRTIHHTTKRIVSASTDSSSDSSATSSKMEEDDGITEWRNALKPHQLNLFDSLVVVSHNLVRYLVDQETAITDIKNDFQLQGLQIVQTMEQTHAQGYKDYVSGLAQRKKTAEKRLKKQEAKLGKLVQGMSSEEKQRSQVARAWDETEHKLRELRDLCT